MKTLSLPLSKKIAYLGVNVESDYNWNIYPIIPVVQKNGNFGGMAKDMSPYLFPAYILSDLPAVLRAIGEKKGWTQKCDCPKGVEIQGYENQICIDDLPLQMSDYLSSSGSSKSICLDLCIAGEVIQLWSLGITTTGCCCGHGGKSPAYIGVIDKDADRMLNLGYVYENEKNQSFKPKSIGGLPECHFSRICELFSATGELGEGSAVETYLTELL